MAFFLKKLAIDIGAANTLIYSKGQGVILDEPAFIAINYWDKKAIAVGAEAKGFMGRTPLHKKSFRPLKDGILFDIPATKIMFTEFYKKIFRKKYIKSAVVFIVPTAISEREKKGIKEAAKEVGAKKIFFLPEAMAAALGANFDVSENKGRLIINIGSSTCEIAVVINSTVTFSKVTSFAGDAIDDAIIKHLKDTYGVHIGENMAEKCKQAIGSALPHSGQFFPLMGKDIQTNAPRLIEVESKGLHQAINEPLEVLGDFLKDSFTKIGSQHIKDSSEDGVLLVGGGSLLPGIEKFLTNKLGVKIVLDKEPLRTVIKGGGMVVERRRKYRKLFLK